MSQPTKIRATLQGEITEIRLLLQHPMENGQRKNPAGGGLIPAHFIQHLSLSANGKVLVEAQLNTSVARNPLFAFRTRGLRVGDSVSVHWRDNLGEQRSDEAKVQAG